MKKILITAFILHLLTSIFILNFHPERIIQDNYHHYADAFIEGRLTSETFSDTDRRLFPLYPIAISLVKPFFISSLYAGIALSIFFSLLALFVAKKVFQDTFFLWLMVFLPPIWLEQSSTVATEAFFIFLTLCALLLFRNKNMFFAGLLIGLAFITRPVALALLATCLLIVLQKKQLQEVTKITGGFFLGVMFLLLFNFIVFGEKELLQQFQHTERYGELRLGFIQIVQDFYRTLDWGEYRTFFSGLFYVVTNLFALIVLTIYRKTSDLAKVCFYWLLFTLLFILTFSPFKLLDDFGRYALAALPAYIYAFTLFYRHKLYRKGEKET